MVIFEAARAITNMKNVSTRELTPAITVLQLFLSSSKPVLRFAAVRTLNKVAMTHPMAVTNCNIDMESLISDQNRSIATLAITTLLKVPILEHPMPSSCDLVACSGSSHGRIPRYVCSLALCTPRADVLSPVQAIR